MKRWPITLSYSRRIQILDVPPGHPNHGVTFQVLQDPTDANPYYYVRNEETGELGIIDRDRVR